MILRFKHFHDSLNIVLILPSGREFFCTKYVQFSLTFRGAVQTHCDTLNVNSTLGVCVCVFVWGGVGGVLLTMKIWQF